jgi:hypothetical protein
VTLVTVTVGLREVIVRAEADDFLAGTLGEGAVVGAAQVANIESAATVNLVGHLVVAGNDDVVARTAVELVLASTANDVVVALVAEDLAPTTSVVQVVVALSSEYPVAAWGARLRVAVVQVVAGLGELLCWGPGCQYRCRLQA